MRAFLDGDFLLNTQTTRQLYHEAAKAQPIYEYYSRMDAEAIVENRPYENLTQLLLSHDHHAWRAMQTAGVDEELIRGNGDDWEKFLAFVRVLQTAIGNPLYHLTHMALRQLLGMEELLSENNARSVWDAARERLKSPEHHPQGLLERSRVQVLCRNEAPHSKLRSYQQAAMHGGLKTRLQPIFCPDGLLRAGQSGFAEEVKQLSAAAGRSIRSIADLLIALELRMDAFHVTGCRAADHSLDLVPRFNPNPEAAERAFRSAMGGEPLKPRALHSYQSYLLVQLGLQYARRGWVQHYHVSALRNTNQRMAALFGQDTGFDALSDAAMASRLSSLLDAQDRTMSLPSTVLYSANPAQNAALIALMGSYQQSGVVGKMQLGAPWRFQNHLQGIQRQLRELSAMSLLSTHIGMTAGGAAISSLARHDYFRRSLCDLIGRWVEAGEFPPQMPLLKSLVRDLSYHNAARYFS